MISSVDLHKMLGKQIIIEIPRDYNAMYGRDVAEMTSGVLCRIKVFFDERTAQVEKYQLTLDNGLCLDIDKHSTTNIYPAAPMGKTIYGE